MSVCKQCGATNADDKKFCSECGHELNSFDPKAVQHALDVVEKEFQRDMNAGLDKSRLTFICDVCGKVNPIDVPGRRCSRCGKKMPRNTYVKALRAIKNSGNLSEPVVTVPTEKKEEQPSPTPQAPAQEYPQQQLSAQQVYRMTGRQNPPQQNNQIVQPFVIVPYVSQNQPLLQYNPNSVYRYHKYTEEEKRENLENLARIQRTQEEEAKRREEEEKRAREATLGAQPVEKKSNVRICAFFSLLFAVIAAFALYGLPFIIDGVKVGETSFLFCFADGTTIVNTVMKLIDGSAQFPSEITAVVTFVGRCILALSLILVIVQSIVRLISGKAAPAGVVIPVLGLVGSIAAYVSYCFVDGQFSAEALKGIYPLFFVFAVVMILAPIILIITTACAKDGRVSRNED